MGLLSQTSPIPRSPDGDNKTYPHTPFNLFQEVLGGGRGVPEMRNFLILSFNYLTSKIFESSLRGLRGLEELEELEGLERLEQLKGLEGLEGLVGTWWA